MAVEKFSTVPCFSPNFQVAVTHAHGKSQTQERGYTNVPRSTLLLSMLLFLKYISDCKGYIFVGMQKKMISMVSIYILKFICSFSLFYLFRSSLISISTITLLYIVNLPTCNFDTIASTIFEPLISHGEILTNVRPIDYTITWPTEGRPKCRMPIGQGKCRTPCIRVDPFIGFIGSKVYTEERPWKVPATWSTSGNVVKPHVKRRHVRYYALRTTFTFWRKK